jgi:hypothetical protein
LEDAAVFDGMLNYGSARGNAAPSNSFSAASSIMSLADCR